MVQVRDSDPVTILDPRMISTGETVAYARWDDADFSKIIRYLDGDEKLGTPGVAGYVARMKLYRQSLAEGARNVPNPYREMIREARERLGKDFFVERVDLRQGRFQRGRRRFTAIPVNVHHQNWRSYSEERVERRIVLGDIASQTYIREKRGDRLLLNADLFAYRQDLSEITRGILSIHRCHKITAVPMIDGNGRIYGCYEFLEDRDANLDTDKSVLD